MSQPLRQLAGVRHKLLAGDWRIHVHRFVDVWEIRGDTPTAILCCGGRGRRGAGCSRGGNRTGSTRSQREQSQSFPVLWVRHPPAFGQRLEAASSILFERLKRHVYPAWRGVRRPKHRLQDIQVDTNQEMGR